MKLLSKIILISISLLIAGCTIGYSAFLISQLQNEEGEVIDDTYDVTFQFADPENTTKVTSITMGDLEEDSVFDLPILAYDKLVFSGWSLESSTSANLIPSDIKTYSVQQAKKTNPEKVIDNKLTLFAVVNNIDSNTVLLNIIDRTISSVGTSYLLKIDANKKFGLFNIKYAGQSTNVSLTIIINDQTYEESINSYYDFSDFGGEEVTIIVSPKQNNG